MGKKMEEMEGPGRRFVDKASKTLTLGEGDYGIGVNGVCCVRPPKQHAGALPDHHIEEHEDCTITVAEEIVLYKENGEVRWRGQLTKGIFIEAG